MICLRAILIALLGVTLLVIEAVVGRQPGPIAILGVAVLLVAALFWFVQWVKSRASEFAVTNKRVIIKVVLIRRDTLEFLLSKVESVGVDQTVMGPIVVYGNIIVVGTGGTREQDRS